MNQEQSPRAPSLSLQRRAPTPAQRSARRTRLILWSTVTVVVVAAIAYSLRPVPVLVDLAPATVSELSVTVDEEAQTRVRDVHVVSAPVAGRMLRIEAEAGDPVIAGQTVIAQIEPVDPAFLDLRTEAQARAVVAAAEAALEHAGAELEQAVAEAEFAEAEFARMERLRTRQTVSERDFDSALRSFRTRTAAVETARAGLAMRASELERAQAELLSPVEAQVRHGKCECVPVLSPVSGQVLRVLQESEGVVAAGQGLLELGDPADLEVDVELLSTEAVGLQPGLDVRIVGWGGARPLRGVLRRIEPFGFTKVSALGIEEQRVKVLIDPAGDDAQWSRLGHGYRVEVEIIVWEDDHALTVPATALFRRGDQWTAFVDVAGYARERAVSVGQRTPRSVQVLDGIDAGEQVIVYPSDRIHDGLRIASR